MLINQNEAANKIDRYKVHRGEPGRNIATEMRNGLPVLENLPLSQAPPSSPLPAVASGQHEAKPSILSQYDRIANYRLTLIATLSKEADKERGPKVEIIDRLLALYNGGLLLPGVLKELGPISLRTLYRFREALRDKGIDGLVPQYGRNSQKPFANINKAEKEFLVKFLLNQNRPNISDAIRECKRYLGEYSVSNSATLRRYINKFRKNNYDIWTLEREGEKAWNDKVAPYQDRDPMSLDVGQVLVADGHKLNANVLNPITGKGKRATIVLFWVGRVRIHWDWESDSVKTYSAFGRPFAIPF